jgi:N-acetylmuramic acid 6-phosphate etherase
LDVNAGQIYLTNDVDLLTASVAARHRVQAVVVLIAGTGSVAMRYTRAAEQRFIRTARSGGWGHLLGDEGGGYAIGLEAIKRTLVVLEEIALGLRTQELGDLERGVVQQLGRQDVVDGHIDLLNAVLCQRSDQSVKARISTIAQIVLNLAGSNEDATAIVVSQVAFLVDNTFLRLFDPKCRDYTPPEECDLVLSGGLMKNAEYQKALQGRLVDRGLRFRSTETVDDAASAGARHLIERK